MSIVKEQISEIFQDSEAPKQFLIGGLLNCIPIANIICLGFCRQIMEEQLDGKDCTTPDFQENWLKFLTSGLGVFIVGAVYALAAAMPAFLMSLSTLNIMSSWKGSVKNELMQFSWSSAVFWGIAGLIGMVLTAVVVVHLPMAVAISVESGEIPAGFRIGTLWDKMARVGSEYYVLCSMLLGIPVIFSLCVFLIPISYVNQLPGILYSFLCCWVIFRGTGKLYHQRLKD